MKEAASRSKHLDRNDTAQPDIDYFPEASHEPIFEGAESTLGNSRKEAFRDYWENHLKDLFGCSSFPSLKKNEIEKQASLILSLYRSFWKKSVYFPCSPDQVKIELIADDILNLFDFKVNYRDDFIDKTHKGEIIFNKRIIKINLNSHPWTIRTTLAHEMYHGLFHTNYALLTGQSISESSSLDMDAKTFSRVVLLPKKRFEKAFGEEAKRAMIDLSDSNEKIAVGLRHKGAIWALANRFGIATKSIEIRIKELKLIDPDVAERYLLSSYFNYQSHFELISNEN